MIVFALNGDGFYANYAARTQGQTSDIAGFDVILATNPLC
jgi:hypothetical protein